MNNSLPAAVAAVVAELAEDDRSAFGQLYATKAKNRGTTQVLAIILSPTIAYLYLGDWAMAALSFFTLQGFFVWWFVGFFASGSWADAANARIAREIVAQLTLFRRR